MSTGAGPFTLYESLGSSSSSASSWSADKAKAHQEAKELLDGFANLHRASFPVAERQTAVAPKLPRFLRLVQAAEKVALKDVGFFDRGARKVAKAAAHAQAESWALDLMALAERERKTQQDRLDRDWDRLTSNDPAQVLAVLRGVFAAARTPASSVHVVADEVGLVVFGPSEDELPVHKPTVTARGSASVSKLNKTERSEWQRQLVASRVLLGAKQVFAGAPGIQKVRVVVTDGPTGRPLLGACLHRSRLSAADFRRDAWRVLEEVDPHMLVALRGRTRALSEVNLAKSDAYEALVGAAV